MNSLDNIIARLEKKVQKYRMCICVIYLISENHGVAFMLRHFLQEYGYGNEVYGYNFPNIYEPYESNDTNYFESGIQFYFHDKIQLISNSDFATLINQFCEAYIGTESKEINELINEVIKRFSA